MRAGGLDERITIQSVETTTGPYGEPIERTVAVATVWAKVMHQTGDESFEAAQNNASRTAKFKTRFRDGIDATMTVLWRSRTYDIHDVDETRRRDDELWITATFNSASSNA